MSGSTARAISRLEALKDEFGAGAAGRKLVLLRAIGRRPLGTVAQVRRLHEVLCFWRAYPDAARVLAEVERLLQRFGARRDVRRFRADLLNSGIAGTDIVYTFGRLTAAWLAAHWPDRLAIEWNDLEDEDRLARALILYALPAEVPGLDEAPLPPRAWLDRLRRPHPTDAAALTRRASAFPVGELVRDRLYEEVRVPCRLRGGPDTPSRTSATYGGSPVVFQTTPLRRDRPDLRAEAMRPPLAVRAVGRRAAERLIDLSRGAMVTRERDLDAFVWADPRDVRLVECGDGLQFACIGALPERRFLLESVYGFLTLKNGVPIGYALASGLLRFSEVAYNVFETFRGGEAAHVYGRLLATVRLLFGSDAFTIHPYQLGDGNEEGIESGAWWFYYKLGFRPRARAALVLVAREVERVRRTPSYRTPPDTLREIVRHPLFLTLDPRRPGALDGPPRLDRLGLRVTDYVTSRFGSDRERAARVCADEAARLLGVGDWRRLPPGERVAWERWGPLVAVLPGVTRWTSSERRALAGVIRAKGGIRETDFVRLLDGHQALGAAIRALCRGLRRA